MTHALTVRLVAVGALVVSSSCLPPPCRFIHGEPVEPPRTEDAAGRALLERAAKDASAAGASELSVVASGLAAEGDRVGGYITMPDAGRCAVVFARSASTVLDVDMFAFDDDGVLVGSDESSDSDAGMLLCSPLGRRLYVGARVVAGAGRVAVGTQLVPLEKSQAVAGIVGARTKLDESGRLDSWPNLEAKVVAHRRAIGGRWSDVWRSASLVDPLAPTRITLTIDRGRCIDVFVTPADDVSSLDVSFEDADGRAFARADVDGRDRTLVVCSEEGDSISVVARPRGGGAGLAAFVVGRSARGASSELERKVRVARVLATGTADEGRAALARELDGVWGKPVAIGSGDARVGSVTSFKVSLVAGCSRLDVVAGRPLGPVAATLWDDKGHLLGESDGASRLTLYACAESAASARLDVESRGRVGPFVVDRRAWSNPPAELLRHGVGLARLLERLVGVEPIAPSVVETAKVVAVADDKLASLAFSVPGGRCVEVVGALDRAGAGLGVRIVDALLGNNVVGRGRFVASERWCATERTPRDLTAELRVDAGPAEALVVLTTVSSDE
ncbi:MAG: hypothetical protein U0271_36440 [Polyangiaceae bacterium]